MKNILLGITGSIAAYKAAEIVRLLVKADFNVKVIMTEHAKQLICPNTLAALSHHPVYDQLFDSNQNSMMHIELGKWADLILIAPATAHFLGKFSLGLADDLLSTVCLATSAKIVLAPAMNKNMWDHFAVKNNVKKIKEAGYEILDPGVGEQACGDYGEGRMLEPSQIVSYVINKNNGLLKGKRVLITAGPTFEPIDPVRFISNRSSGKMGYSLANVCYELGADVTLISGPTLLPKPNAHQFFPIQTAEEMYQTVMQNIADVDLFISCAAVADYSSKNVSNKKIKKSDSMLSLELVKTKDILLELSKLEKKPIMIGFSLETEDLVKNSKNKLIKKKLDAIIANQLSNSHMPFNSDYNEVFYISKKHDVTKIEMDIKSNVSRKIIGLIVDEFFSND